MSEVMTHPDIADRIGRERLEDLFRRHEPSVVAYVRREQTTVSDLPRIGGERLTVQGPALDCGGVRRNTQRMRAKRAFPRNARGFVLAVFGCVVCVGTVACGKGADTHWYGIGAPNHPQSEAFAFGVGNAIPGGGQLLPLRVPDPQGGPPWGVRIVRTEQGSCLEVGRVEDGQLVSLGIDYYWHNDHLFHPYPINWVGGDCGHPSFEGEAQVSGTPAPTFPPSTMAPKPTAAR